MNLIHTSINKQAYPLQFLYLVATIFTVGSIFTGFALALQSILGISPDQLQNLDASKLSVYDINVLKLIQSISAIGLFVVPALVFAWLKKTQANRPFSYLRCDKGISERPTWLTIIITISALPALSWVMYWNQQVELPSALMANEEQLEQLTLAFLSMNNIFDLFINLMVVAVIPAIGEELLFRGGIQQFLGEWTKKPHVAIWLTAIIFSAFHFQFLGFFPRMFIGAFLGYLFFWSGNLWYPIIGHFVNNGLQVCMVYLLGPEFAATDVEQMQEMPIIPALVGLATMLLGMYYFRQYFRKNALNTSNITDTTINQSGAFAATSNIHNMHDWIKVYSHSQLYAVEIAKAVLADHGVKTVVFNKQDSAYIPIGEIELYAPKDLADRAKQVIIINDL